ncbi:origin recognition complex subunit 2 [Trichomonascus vanleenenianus]|uniref:origin recognition complex subunit 2 n=1 Tax=Trichomonascus vanleenenianus TaxID=2268995 RepID=UPI003ECABFC4
MGKRRRIGEDGEINQVVEVTSSREGTPPLDREVSFEGPRTPSLSPVKRASAVIGDPSKGDITRSPTKSPHKSPLKTIFASSSRRRTPFPAMMDKSPGKGRDWDLSARKRATKFMMERIMAGREAQDDSSEELDEEDEAIAEKIIRESNNTGDSLLSPLKGRKRKSIKELRESQLVLSEVGSAPVSLFLDGSEGFFEQHRMKVKVSATPFSNVPEIDYDAFNRYIDESREDFADQKHFLVSLYRTMYPQWTFEMGQGFNLVFYGVGSKHDILLDFVERQLPGSLPVLVVNGYNSSITIKEVIQQAATVLLGKNSKVPQNFNDLIAAMAESGRGSAENPKLAILLHNIDGEYLRNDKTQALLAKLASIRQLWLVASVDSIRAPLLWDAAKLAQFNFLWHDLTTFELYSTETSFGEPLSLGRNEKTVGVKGAKYVLASLTRNEKHLYRILACHQLETMTESLSQDDSSTPGSVVYGIEFKLFYQRCMAELITSNELNFRTMLTEFIEHRMAVLSREASGTEVVYIPYTKPGLETLLMEMDNDPDFADEF